MTHAERRLARVWRAWQKAMLKYCAELEELGYIPRLPPEPYPQGDHDPMT